VICISFGPSTNCLHDRHAGLQESVWFDHITHLYHVFSWPPCRSTRLVSVLFGRVLSTSVHSSRPSTAIQSGLTGDLHIQEHGRPLEADVCSRCAQSQGTVYLLSWEHSVCLLRRFPSDWRRFSSTVIDSSLQRTCCSIVLICVHNRHFYYYYYFSTIWLLPCLSCRQLKVKNVKDEHF